MSHSPDNQKPKRQFISFQALRVDPAWRRLPEDERRRDKDDFVSVLQTARDRDIICIPYSTVGTRGDCEMLLWLISYELEAIQRFKADLTAAGVGRWTTTPHSFLAQSKRSTYVDKINPEHETSRQTIMPGRGQYIFVYPFVKTRDWYMLGSHTRQGIMDEHIEIGNRYPSVKLNTCYSFGLDDQEFVVAFESNNPSDFVDLVMELRHSDGSPYTERDTPIITGIRCAPEELVELLGG